MATYAERCSNCKSCTRDEEWETLVCMNPKSDNYLDWVDESNNCYHWEEDGE